MENIKIKQSLPSREDGKETRARIIQCAGQLIAQQGYAKTTSKSICQLAQVNMAAVNYHFGSRDGLYIAVLKEVHSALLSLDSLQALAAAPLTAEEKIECFLDKYILIAADEADWHLQVWARELLNPSPFIGQIIDEEAKPKLAVLLKIFAEYLQRPVTDPLLYSSLLGTMAPFILMFLGRTSTVSQHIPQICSKEQLQKNIKDFVFAGLEAMKAKEQLTTEKAYMNEKSS